VILWGLPDLRSILLPPPPPSGVGPGSPSPDYLCVSLATNDPDAFEVAFESNYWANRRSDVSLHGGANASTRAEIRLRRLSAPTSYYDDDGMIWVERRRRFLNREFEPGERVGCYTLAYLISISRE